MKSLFVALCALICAYAAVDEKSAEILKSDFQINPEGYHYAWDSSNGIQAEAQGLLKTIDKDQVALQVHGSNHYQSPEGEKVELTFVADENGYQPQGSHLPTPQPIPDYIQKSIEYIKTHPYDEKAHH